jgi:hypothetical protein
MKKKPIIEVCPLCGSKMEKGFIGVWQGIYWSKEKHRAIWKLPFGDDMIYRVSSKNPMIEAYRCKKCKLVVFRYGETDKPAEGSP